ncbi:MAG: FHA domain-containing protein [Clostridia bacterium]|nr:FHA domain-containing protein [Clostridia bacterium]
MLEVMLPVVLKYIFITVIYLFIFGIIRLIYLDIESMHRIKSIKSGNFPYLKLINQRDQLSFKVDESYILDKDLTFGRSRKSDIVIFDPFLSGRHVKITLNNGKCAIEDLGSTNGSFVNGTQVVNVPRPLKDGDRIHIGQLDFLFVNNIKRGV